MWYLAQVMPRDGYAVKFNADGSFAFEMMKMVKTWKLIDNELTLLDEDGHQWFRFKYSASCGTLVHEYELYETPQVIDIGLVQ